MLGGQAQLEKAEIRDGRPRNIVWINDMLGQAIRRDERDNQTGGDPHEIWHRLSGRQMGYVGHSVNNDVQYTQSNANRVYGANPTANADFDLAYNAHVVAVGLVAPASVLLPQTPGWVVVVILAPVVEESIRLIAALQVARRIESRFGLAFGIGYGLLEAGLKLGDHLVLIARSGSTDPADWLTATIFVVPFVLHLFLSVLVFTLLRRGVAPLVVLVVAMACHAFHNWTVLAALPTDVPGVLLSVAVRTPLLLGLTVLAAHFAPLDSRRARAPS